MTDGVLPVKVDSPAVLYTDDPRLADTLSLVTELEDVNDVDDFAIRLAELLSPILLDDAGELSAASKGLVGAVPGPLGDLPPAKPLDFGTDNPK